MKWVVAFILFCLSIVTRAQTIEYVHTDPLGSPVAITNQSGQVIERMQFEPYGARIGQSNSDRPGYTGHVMDRQSGLTYMQQRYYDPAVGRFLSTDPVTANSNPGANFNRYWYAKNSPYGFSDPDGREAACVTLRVNCFDSGGSFEAKATTLAGFAGMLLTAGAGSEFAPPLFAMFGKAAVKRELSREARKGIRSLEKEIEKHLEKIKAFKENPTVKPGMEKMSKEAIRKQQQRRIWLLEQEIQKFRNNIEKLKNPPPPTVPAPPPPPSPPPKVS